MPCASAACSEAQAGRPPPVAEQGGEAGRDRPPHDTVADGRGPGSRGLADRPRQPLAGFTKYKRDHRRRELGSSKLPPHREHLDRPKTGGEEEGAWPATAFPRLSPWPLPAPGPADGRAAADFPQGRRGRPRTWQRGRPGHARPPATAPPPAEGKQRDARGLCHLPGQRTPAHASSTALGAGVPPHTKSGQVKTPEVPGSRLRYTQDTWR